MPERSRLLPWTWILALLACPGVSSAKAPIPAQGDWVDQGVALQAGGEGTWDARMYGQISPSAVVRKDGTWFLYYVGADGDRKTDGGPRHRALGVATSTDGIHFAKHPGNPVVTHLPHGNEEEGVFSTGALIAPSGEVVLHYGAIWAANATTESVQGNVALARSTDGLTFSDEGTVLSWQDPAVWGSGDELIPLGTWHSGPSWGLLYVAKGGGASWDLAVATGSSMSTLDWTAPLLTTHDVIGGGDPVPLGDGTYAVFVVRSFEQNLIEVYTLDPASPGSLQGPVQTYTMFPPRYRHTVVTLDAESQTWFMYQSTDRAEDGNHIRVRTAKVGASPLPPPGTVEVGPEEVAGPFAGSRPSIDVDSAGQPHIVVDKDWSNVLYAFHKLGGVWSQELLAQGAFGAERTYLPHMEIDASDRAWISAWVATKNDESKCGQGVWLLDKVSSTPTLALTTKVYTNWSNGNLSLDPAHPDQCVVMGHEGKWIAVGAGGQELASGKMDLGSTGEKIRFAIAPNPGGDGVWHGVMGGWSKFESAYRNSTMAGTQTWAAYGTYPEQGDDVTHPSVGLDGADPAIAYIAAGYAPGVVVNVWNGAGFVFPPTALAVADPAPAKYGNGVDRFGPQWAPALPSGAYLCWSSADGFVKLRHVAPDGVMGPAQVISKGSRCAIATSPNGHIHVAYVHGGMRYREVVPEEPCGGGCDDGDPCTEDACDVGTGVCTATPIASPECAECAPRAATTCIGGDLRWLDGCGNAGEVADACDDGDTCTLDGCEGSACTHTPTGADGCQPDCGGPAALVCVQGVMVRQDACGRFLGKSSACDDGDPCTTDSCDVESFVCIHVPQTAEACAGGLPNVPGPDSGAPSWADAAGSFTAGADAGTGEPATSPLGADGCATGGAGAGLPGLLALLALLGLCGARRSMRRAGASSHSGSL